MQKNLRKFNKITRINNSYLRKEGKKRLKEKNWTKT